MASKYPTKCSSCGGDLVYDPKSAALKCKNCNNFVPVKLHVAHENDYLEAEINEKAWSGETKSIKCNSCGAVDIMNKGDFADVCPYCGSSNIVDSSANAGLKPDGIMPFSISKEDAEKSFMSKVKNSFWAPSSFKKSVEIDKIKSIYTPVFSFDSKTLTTYDGRLGKDEEVRRRDINGEWRTETETTWFNVSGTVRHYFDDEIIAAGQMVSSSVLKDLEPYNSNASIEFDPLFLSGSTANSYKKDLKTSFQQAKQSMEFKVRDIILKKHEANKVARLDLNMNLIEPKYKYLLLPVYISGYRYKDKNYNIYVNGTTGKVAGKLPVSKKKVWAAVLGGLAAVGGLIALICLL